VIGWLLRFLGQSDEVASNFSHAELRWGHGELMVIGLILLVPVGWFIVRRQRQNLAHISPRARQTLSACRIGVLLLLVIVMGAPYLHTDETLDLKPVVAVVVDDSTSMDLPVGPLDLAEAAGLGKVVEPPPPPAGGEKLSDEAAQAAHLKRLSTMTRAALLDAVLRKSQAAVLDPLTEKFELKFYRVAQHAAPTTLAELLEVPKQAAAADADRGETDLGQAILQVVDDARGRKIAGLVLMTDGRATNGPDPVAVARSLVELSADESPAPVYSIPIGSEHAAPDVAVVEVSAPPQVAKDDTVNVEVTLSSSGFNGQAVTLELHDGDGPALSTQQLKLTGARRQTALFTYHAEQAGTRLLRATALPLPAETVGNNNSATATVRVSSEPTKLLYLEGIARWDFRFLDHALRRDKAMTTTFVVESQLEADGVSPDKMPEVALLPKDREKWAEYHVVMLGDISPALLPDGEQTALVEAIQQDGLGLIVQCGSRHMPWDFAGGPLANILPMRFDATSASASATKGLSAPAFAPFRMLVTPAGAAHPAFATTGDASQDRDTWSRMPEFFWAAAGSQLKPGATRLAEIETSSGKEKLPILAEQFVGRGRVLVVGCDETFRWRRNVGDRIFYRFWGQSLRHVARKPQHDGQESWLEVEPQRVSPGNSVTIDLYAVDESSEPLEQDSLSVTVGGAGAPESVRLEPFGDAGHFRGTWTSAELGVHNVEFAGAKEAKLSASVEVADSGRELSEPEVNREMLGTLAQISGGAMLELPQFAELPARLAGEVTHLDRPYEQDLWDNWFLLVLLAGLYCTDVGIRRVYGLL
jgi:hypothetical protein